MKAARIIDGIVQEISEVPEGVEFKDFFNPEVFVEAPDNAVVGGTHKNGKFGPMPEQKPPVFTWEMVRRYRNMKLAQTDWTQLSDTPEKVQKAYRGYRQALRDIPTSAKDPGKVKWPELPK